MSNGLLETMKQKEKYAADLKKELDDQKTKASALQMKYNEMRIKNKALADDNLMLSVKLRETRKTCDSVRGRLNEQNALIEKRSVEYENLKYQLEKKSNEYDELFDLKKSLNSKYLSMSEKIEKLEDDNRVLKSQNKDLEDYYKNLTNECEQLRKWKKNVEYGHSVKTMITEKPIKSDTDGFFVVILGEENESEDPIAKQANECYERAKKTIADGMIKNVQEKEYRCNRILQPNSETAHYFKLLNMLYQKFMLPEAVYPRNECDFIYKMATKEFGSLTANEKISIDCLAVKYGISCKDFTNKI